MKNITILLIYLFTFHAVIAQESNNLQVLNGYEFVKIVPTGNPYHLEDMATSAFAQMGFKLIDQQTDLSSTQPFAQAKTMQVIVSSKGRAVVSLIIKNCNDSIIYRKSYHSMNWNDNYPDNFQRALNGILSNMKSFTLKYDPSLTPKINLPTVEKIDITENKAKQYFNTNQIDLIEGIYKSMNDSYYRLAIKKYNNSYAAIILESDENSVWKPGEIKAYIEPSSAPNVYSIKWYTANKLPYETFGILEKNAILSVEFNNSETNSTFKFMKLFPSVNSIDSSKDENISNKSGSGFFINKNGLIATNAHVIKNAKKIEIHINSDNVNKYYNAELVLKDDVNDIAILKISDPKFSLVSELPYGFEEKINIGESIFTIGFPLNEIMGDRYKVTNGIVSSIFGIENDVRYMQISVPLQPGNSGGALFNKEGNIIGITSTKLNGEALGLQIENVNYAIKISYLKNLCNMLPDAIHLSPSVNMLSDDLQEQVIKLKNFVCLIKVFQ